MGTSVVSIKLKEEFGDQPDSEVDLVVDELVAMLNNTRPGDVIEGFQWERVNATLINIIIWGERISP